MSVPRAAALPAAEPYTGSAAEWDAFAARQEGATHCHLLAWKRVIERAYGHECPYLALRGEDGALRGVLPLARVSVPGFGRHLVSLPFLNGGGPLGGEEARAALAAAAEARARRERCDTLELRCGAPLRTSIPPYTAKVTCVLDLPGGDGDALWKTFPAKLRAQVRRPAREGVEVRFGADQVEPFHQVFARNMRDLGAPAHSRAFFAAVAEELGAAAWFGCAWLRGRPVAAGCALAWGGTVEMVWASSLREAAACAPNMGLYGAFLHRAAGEGARRFDFGRCTPGGGTHRFKQQWGTRDVPLPWYRRERRPGASSPSPDRGTFALGTRLWRHLPLPVANLIGPGIRRAIPL